MNSLYAHVDDQPSSLTATQAYEHRFPPHDPVLGQGDMACCSISRASVARFFSKLRMYTCATRSRAIPGNDEAKSKMQSDLLATPTRVRPGRRFVFLRLPMGLALDLSPAGQRRHAHIRFLLSHRISHYSERKIRTLNPKQRATPHIGGASQQLAPVPRASDGRSMYSTKVRPSDTSE